MMIEANERKYPFHNCLVSKKAFQSKGWESDQNESGWRKNERRETEQHGSDLRESEQVSVVHPHWGQ